MPLKTTVAIKPNLGTEIWWMSATILQEAANQAFSGKLAVAFVIMHRAEDRAISPIEVVLQPFQFSCWNTDSPTKKMLPYAENSSAWHDCFMAASAAYFNLLQDSSNGATHYLNPKAVKKLPSWYEKKKIVAIIDAHEFLKL
jgi:spore germination cell wall hydrolase CwlJ-like protein